MYIKQVTTKEEKQLLIGWYNAINWKGMQEELFPETSYIVYDGDTPVASSYFSMERSSPCAFLGITISNPEYKGNKTEYVDCLLDAVMNEMKREGCKIAYYYTDIHSEKFLNKYMIPRGFRFEKGFSGAVALDSNYDPDFII
tara:strand:+ start:355 stop:780 length:426 start_codon:yes stop_codon:yes gene_type:complete